MWGFQLGMGREKDERPLLERLKEYIGIGNGAYKAFFDAANMQRGLVCAALTCVVALSALILFLSVQGAEIQTVFNPDQTVNLFYSRVWAYLLFFVASIFTYFTARAYDRGRSYTHFHLTWTVVVYTVTSAVFGIWVSAIDHLSNVNVFVFFITMVLSTCLFVMPPLYVVPYTAISFMIFFQMCYLGGGVDFPFIYNSVLLMLALDVASGVLYRQKLIEAKKTLELRSLVEHNAVTGLKNRRAMEREYDEYIGKQLYVATLSIEEFKFYNDCYGRQAGDEILKKIAKILTDTDWDREIYHVGTSGFIMFLWDLEPIQFEHQCAEWLEQMSEIGFADIATADLSCNVGYVYGKPLNVAMMQRMVSMSEHQNYQACRLGRNRYAGDEYDRLAASLDELSPMSRIYSENDMDPLTGLMTMNLFRDRALKVWTLNKLGDKGCCFVYFDMANFKSYNQKYGFAKGDELIAKVGMMLKEAFSEYIICRVTADQFVMFCYEEGTTGRIEAVHNRIRGLDTEIRLELKAGIYCPNPNEKDVSLISDKAKIACDSIKGRFDICWRYFDGKMASELDRKEYIINSIDAAVENEYIEVYYHPLMRNNGRVLCGAEALARWNDPVYGFLSPADFIPVLEENNLIYKLDRFMIRKICQNQRRMMDDYGIELPVSFNLSRSDFSSVDTVRMVDEAVQEFMISKDLLHVEVTESSLSEDAKFLLGEMQRFHDHGYHVWMDDFGSGYSSLNILQDYDFDVLKIDMEFLRSFHQNPRTKEVISAIIDMTKRLGIEALAEGVEEEEQYEFLRSIGCEMSQGYLFDRPEPYDKWVEFARHSQIIQKEALH